MSNHDWLELNTLLEAEELSSAEERKLNSLISRAAAEDCAEHNVVAAKKVTAALH